MSEEQQNALLAAVPLLPTACIIAWGVQGYPKLWFPLGVLFVVSLLAFVLTLKLIGSVKEMTLQAGLGGFDINKKGTPMGEKKVPESLGIVPGTVHLICVIVFQVYYYVAEAPDTPWLVKLEEYNAALAATIFMIFLGFADDVLELRWRYKLFLPTIASLPLLISYAGSTTVIVPNPFAKILGRVLELGVFYKIYMGLLSVFCTNSINILAGINGLEVGQSVIIACAVVIHNVLQLSSESGAAHVFSIFFLVPFIMTSLALLYHNWYPSKVFVGDTYTYFAGMTFAVVGILGHFSKTLLLFFIPQLINFLYSLPQLFGIVFCPRHRLPHYNTQTKLLEGKPSNMNLVNLTLLITGPLSERTLCILLLAFQMVCCGIGFLIRYSVIAELFYED
mmetsp:Transcript_43681/g.106791  ORF Transcript_43681/g.106791 Transcript_43681/m.106791 type:complete len:392 (+) Transcript_43681:124-1299(+)|eukprot:CAMPEP_0206239068 /NCGR_PEP_ID=MMETSP0047_2-20121206/15174_1 /ASSEMBLY_ACC=CAM_ASM_000192 /TAXON_ID=195065 /ORGANISM="Chroomonas mesostigmatica_cf, Strain CCMP1168" /LENGTH=391 /DNA_ID=CAMNT_0053663691 /DNA_START=118 /DNA_END=1293 /DNA_ORIENTATION=-